MAEQASPAAAIGLGKQAEWVRKTLLLNVLTLSSIVIGSFFLALMYLPIVDSHWVYKLIFVALIACCVVSFVLNRAGRVGLAAVLFTCSLTLAIFGVILFGVFEAAVVGWVVYYFLVPVLVAGMVVGARATFSFATLDALLIAVVTLAARRVLPYDPIYWSDDVLGVVIPAGVLCYVMAIVAWLYARSLDEALRQMAEQSQQLSAANEEIHAFSRSLEEKVAQRTRELRNFVSMVAHDLRNPLTVIRGIADLLLEEQAGDVDQRRNRHISMLATNVEHMLDLTDDLLEMSHLSAGNVEFDMEALPIQMVVEEVCAGFEARLAAKRLGLKVEVSPDLAPVWADHLRLTQVLNNLVANAYHYTPAGAIFVRARQVDSLVEVSVSDTGIGISAEDQKHLFQQFFRGEHEVVRKTKGAGLGLAISQAIVEAHGGQIWVESEVGQGSTFYFTVSVAPNPPPA